MTATTDPVASQRILVAMSGGVDSSVAAALLVEAGHDVTGVTLKLWGGDQDSGCCSVSDVEDARRVAAQLGIPHYVFNFGDEFLDAVVDPYVAAYAAGTTPNPCIECNRTMKWGRLLDRCGQLGFATLATGHHARTVRTERGTRLARGADAAKDQSYVLYMLDESQLERTMLPVGAMTKAEVRDHAQRLGLRTASKSESMDVCFITKGGREAFLGARVPRLPGRIVATDGTEVGRHDGIDRFTIGQRRGLGVAAGDRRYVVDIDATTSTVVIGERHDLLSASTTLRDLHLVESCADGTRALLAQTSAHGVAAPCVLDGSVVRWSSAHPRVAPGQAVVLYDAALPDVVLGGGTAA